MLKSMTGFSCFQGQINDWHVLIEMKSVNARFLDIHCRLPDILSCLETSIEQQIRQQISRGRIDFRCTMTPVARVPTVCIDTHHVTMLRDLAARVNEAFPSAAPLSVSAILAWPGVVISGDPGIDASDHEVLLTQTAALIQAHQESCCREGAAILLILQEKLAAIDAMVTDLKAQKARLLYDYQEKMRERLRALLTDCAEDAWQQEILLYSLRADIAEEIDRLSIHVGACAELLLSSGPVGKRLDFLMQEFNREANTIAAKSATPAIAHLAINLKVCIEEMREQIQNVE